MAFELPKLPYDFDALEPHIDKETMNIHYTKHHAGYVSKLNAALEGQDELLSMNIEELLGNIDKVPQGARQAVINNGGGHANHSLFWEIMSPKGGGQPDGELAEAIKSTFNDFETFKEKFTEKALGVFGSGWAFLQVEEGRLSLKKHSFQNSPYLHGKVPILGLDVWEHAYYLKYQNRRADYVAAFWEVVNWPKVSENFKKAL